MLAIETSCDETAASVLGDDGHVMSNIVASQIPIHARFGGVVPELASRNHLTAIGPTVDAALGEAGITYSDLTAIAVTQGPGLAGCLLVGIQFAKSLAYALGVPLIPVNHIQAHVHAIFLKDTQGAGQSIPKFPYLALAVSGGHTSLYVVHSPGHWEVKGQTVDDAAGEAFDKAAKMMGLPYPGGVEIDRLSKDGDSAAFAFPRPMLHKGLDFSFSGLKTALRYTLNDLTEAGTQWPMADLAASYQEAIVDCLVKKACKAARETGILDVVVAGGVACNSRLRERILEDGGRRGLKVYLTPPRYCTDNAAMVGGLGLAQRADHALIGDALLPLDIYTTQRPRRR